MELVFGTQQVDIIKMIFAVLWLVRNTRNDLVWKGNKIQLVAVAREVEMYVEQWKIHENLSQMPLTSHVVDGAADRTLQVQY